MELRLHFNFLQISIDWKRFYSSLVFSNEKREREGNTDRQTDTRETRKAWVRAFCLYLTSSGLPFALTTYQGPSAYKEDAIKTKMMVSERNTKIT